MSDLRERVAEAIYEGKRARLIEAFGDTAGWPEWEKLKSTLKEIQMEECDPYIALVLEEAARVAMKTAPKDADFERVWTEYEHGVESAQYSIAAAIRALGNKNDA